MESPYRTHEAVIDSPSDVFRSEDIAKVRQLESLLKERDELRKRLEEKATELARAEDVLRGEIAKRQGAEQALREAEKNFAILTDYANEGVQTIEKIREQFQEVRMQSTRGKTLITAFLHDLKGPITMISSCAQFCMGHFPQLPPLEKNLKIIYEGTQRAIKLIKKFMEVFEVEMLRSEPVKINEVIVRAWQTAQQDTQALQVSFEANLEKELPEVMGNSEGLERVFFNLFLNAIQAISPGGKVMVEADFLSSEKMVEISVLDNGPGIPKENRRKIFEHFFTTKTGGTGLGLSLCQAIIKQHQGEIHVECPPSGGTKISVLLPIAESKSNVEVSIDL